MTLYFHFWQNLMRGWIYRNIIFSFPTIFGVGVLGVCDCIVPLYFHSWQYLVRGDYIVTYFHSWQYFVRGCIVTLYFHSRQYLVSGGWLYRDIIFLLLTISGEGVIISWHYIFTLDNIWWVGGDYIVTLYFYSWQYLVRGWLYRYIIFLLLTISGEWGVIISWHYIFTPDNIWWGGDYIVTLYFYSWQYLVSGGWLYRDIIFLLLTISGEGVIISWHYIFTPDNIWWGGDYIVTLYFYSWQYLYRDTIFSLLTISGEGVIISWHHMFTSDNIWWGGDYIVTSHFHFWNSRIRHWMVIIFEYFHDPNLTLQWYQDFIIHIQYIYSPHETWGWSDYI